jgi:hypothetical protein
MRNIALLLCMVLLSGCATLPFLQDREQEEFHTSYLTVTSTPPDAEIYINDRLVGRTPSNNVPLYAKYSVTVTPLWKTHATVKEGYILRVSKSGYKEAVEEIRFTWGPEQYKQGILYQVPIRTTYHFDLEKE